MLHSILLLWCYFVRDKHQFHVLLFEQLLIDFLCWGRNIRFDNLFNVFDEVKKRVFVLTVILAHVHDLTEFIIIACSFFSTRIVLLMPFCYKDFSFAKNSIFSSFWYIYADVCMQLLALASWMQTRIILLASSIDILLLVLNFSWIKYII